MTVTPDDIGWAWDDELTPVENAVAAVNAMPDDVGRGEIDDFLLRYVRAVGPSVSAEVIEQSDHDVAAYPAADFM